MPTPAPIAPESALNLKTFAILNPKAGTCTAEDVRRALMTHFACEGGNCDVHETTGQEDLTDLARSARERGVDLVIAAGGDGTVSAVAEGLVGGPVPLGIIPLGTANVLSRELGIPIDLEGACALIAGEHGTTAIDALKVGERHFYTQVGVGIDALMIRDTKTEAKKRFGKLAYLWSAGKHLLGFQPRRFEMVVDGRRYERHASQILLANCGTLGQEPFRWGPNIRPDDGQVDVCVVRARTALDYAELAFRVAFRRHRESPNVRYYACKQSVSISSRKPLPVQADGEIIGETPVEVRVVPGVLKGGRAEGLSGSNSSCRVGRTERWPHQVRPSPSLAPPRGRVNRRSRPPDPCRGRRSSPATGHIPHTAGSARIRRPDRAPGRPPASPRFQEPTFEPPAPSPSPPTRPRAAFPGPSPARRAGRTSASARPSPRRSA